MTRRTIWMPVDGDYVVSGQISGFSYGRTMYPVFLFRPCFYSLEF